MNILAAGFTVSCIFLYLRYFKINYDEEKHFLKVKNQKKELYYFNNFQKKYFNLWNKDNRNIFHMLKWFFEKKPKYNYKKGQYYPESAEADINVYGEFLNKEKDFLIWIGHNTSLIKLENSYFLVDPVFSDEIFFTKRKKKAALNIEQINKLLKDRELNILITHNHYDHLEIESLKKLDIRGRIFVPLGVASLLKKLKDIKITEMNWWDKVRIDNIELTFLPAQHYSHRIKQRKNKSLWGSYIIENNNKSKNIFIGGDSGYFGAYKEFGQKYNINYALLPVGGYDVRWYAAYEHLNIEDSLRVIKDLGCKYMFPVHWGAFHLGVEPPDYTGFRFSEILDKNMEAGKNIKLLNLGGLFFLD